VVAGIVCSLPGKLIYTGWCIRSYSPVRVLVGLPTTAQQTKEIGK
jgi:hypothetical protein